MDPAAARRTLAIVGGGFCGTVLAAKLLQRPPAGATDIVLIERGTEIGRGVAYAVHEFPYLLNVPAGRLSVDSREPTQFLRFAQRRAPRIGAEDFLPRALYGAYLQDFLLHAERLAPSHVRLTRVIGEVRGIRRGEGGFTLEVAGSPALDAGRVVLALGNPPPARMPWADPLRDHPAYRHDPWNLPASSARQTVLVVGNGLTMADAVSRLTEDAMHAPMVHTLSRHGLLPLHQTSFRPTAIRGDGEALIAKAGSLREVLAMTRQLADEVEYRGGDWREVVTFIRHLGPALWREFPESERRRFMRHLHAYWDVHRHRLPPQLAARIDHLRRGGTLRVHAGRIESVEVDGERLRVGWRPRGHAPGSRVNLSVDLVVNATGPDYSLARSTDPLQRSLRESGLIAEDALGLGIRTGEFGECVGADGEASRRLYYLGPMLRASFWEATAATELRDHADALAGHLAASG